MNHLAAELFKFSAKINIVRIGVDALGSTREEFAKLIREEVGRMGKVIEEAGIREK